MTQRVFLADTNVISSKITALQHPYVARWLADHAEQIRISVVSLGEIERGLLMLERTIGLRRNEASTQAKRQRVTQMRAWQADLTHGYASQIVSVDLPVALKWAEISARFPQFKDGDKLIAATAIVKGYVIATRNIRDFTFSGVSTVNPFDPSTWTPKPEGDPIALLRR